MLKKVHGVLRLFDAFRCGSYRVDDVGKTVWFQIPIPSEILPTFEQGMKYMMAPQKKFVSDPQAAPQALSK